MGVEGLVCLLAPAFTRPLRPCPLALEQLFEAVHYHICHQLMGVGICARASRKHAAHAPRIIMSGGPWQVQRSHGKAWPSQLQLCLLRDLCAPGCAAPFHRQGSSGGGAYARGHTASL